MLQAVSLPRMTLDGVSTAETETAEGYARTTRRVSVATNVPYTLVAHLPRQAGGSATTVEVRDRTGRWVPLRAGGGVTLAEGAAARGSHAVQCRVTVPAGAPASECAVDYELVSAHPQFPMRVRAMTGLLVAQRP
jgi:hypothetical protein